MTWNLQALTLLTELAVAAAFISACGGGSSTPATTAPTSTTVATSAPTAASASPPSAGTAISAPPSAAGSAASGAGCDNAAVAVNKATNASTQSDEVFSIDLAGGCATVVISSSFTLGTASSQTAAVTLCNTAATAAYANGVSAVKVIAADGTSVAASGKKGSTCSVPK